MLIAIIVMLIFIILCQFSVYSDLESTQNRVNSIDNKLNEIHKLLTYIANKH